jgi:hypothetical protein
MSYNALMALIGVAGLDANQQKEVLRIGQKAINWAKGVGEPPTEDDLKFLESVLHIPEETKKEVRNS